LTLSVKCQTVACHLTEERLYWEISGGAVLQFCDNYFAD